MAYQATASEKELIKGLILSWREAKNIVSQFMQNDETFESDELYEQYDTARELIADIAKETLNFIKASANAAKLDWQSIDTILASSHMTNVYMEAIEKFSMQK